MRHAIWQKGNTMKSLLYYLSLCGFMSIASLSPVFAIEPIQPGMRGVSPDTAIAPEMADAANAAFVWTPAHVAIAVVATAVIVGLIIWNILSRYRRESDQIPAIRDDSIPHTDMV